MASIEEKIESWKKQLLDLGKRNHLVNYRETKRGTLRITRPDFYALWDKFVRDENPLIFPNASEEDLRNNDASEDEMNLLRLMGPTISRGDIETDKSFWDQQSTLRNLRSKAKTFMEEQGINVLYLSFGFLHWNEKDGSSEFFDAPLILVPVSIDQETLLSPYQLSIREDDIITNPTIAYKLENDYGIILPTFNADEDELGKYLKEVQNKIQWMHEWSIIEKVSLGLLSFQKINMYNDLEKRKDDIINNPVVQALNGNAAALNNYDFDEIENFNFDQEKPESVFQVVDADSSQQKAILCAQRGMSFVLQGPPGTGKSQTITNIIAEQLAAGKKVLFVSEKKAALDVVYSRLKKANLADFCLVLHSDKANKKELMAQFRDVLDLTNKHVMIQKKAYEALDQLQICRDELDQYSDALFEVVQPLGKTIYEANGIIAGLNEYPDVVCKIDNIKNISGIQYRQQIATLTKLSNKLKDMPGGIKNNPWKECNVEFINNELRQSLNYRCNNILEGITEIKNTSESAAKDFSIKPVENYQSVVKLYAVIKQGENAPDDLVPEQWMDSANESAIQAAIGEGKTLHSKYEKALKCTLDAEKKAELDGSSVSTFSIESCVTQITNVQNEMDNNAHYRLWENNNRLSRFISRLKDELTESANLCEEIDQSFDEGIYDIASEEMLTRFRTDYQSVFKILKAQYREDKKQISAHTKIIGTKLSDEDMIRVLVNLHKLHAVRHSLESESQEYQDNLGDLFHGTATNIGEIDREQKRFEALEQYIGALNELKNVLGQEKINSDTYRFLFKDYYSGFDTDWDKIESNYSWAKNFVETLKENEFYNDGLIGAASKGRIFADHCAHYHELLSNGFASLDKDLTWFVSLFDHGADFESEKLDVLSGKVSDCRDNLSALEDWIDYKKDCKDGEAIGLGDYISQAMARDISVQDLVPAYKKRFFQLWLDQIEPDYPAVANFRTSVQNERISTFSELDRQQFDIARNRIRGLLINRLPAVSSVTRGDDEISILKREANKQRKIMPVRKLFAKIPDLIQTLKPCMMMSPLSVSVFLESPDFVFDTVIFDEASQVKTENAIGAIIRGKQVIIAGDSHQLPPTNFFVSGVSDEESDDDEDETGSFESVLDEAALLPQETLLWHYRSRNEQLIAFSNAKIYRNKLITFPSSIESGRDVGVEFISVPDGFYDRGGRKGNVPEAKKVAELVYQHFATHPDRSLGVTTFGVVQQLAIEDQIRQLRMNSDNRRFEKFFDENRDEPFFVKSLENVQGDERDTIIFSVGYGKDAYGKMYNNFGPLSKDGGERRLNVAVTRAKYNIKLVSSILATDINVDSPKEGTRLLRSYIDYAIRGPQILETEPTEAEELKYDSPFEESVYNFLTEKEYKVGTQVGCSGFRIDLGIKHPTLNGRYVLGIECDGATYHSAKTARERDRLRQDILEQMGWKIYRIWSTDWIKDPNTEGQKLIHAVDDAIASYSEDSIPVVEHGKDIEKQVNMLKIQDVSEDDKRDLQYKFKEYPIFSYTGLRNIIKPYTQEGVLRYIVELLYPISFDDICRLFAPCMGKERVSSTVKDTVLKLLHRHYNGFVSDAEGFYSPVVSKGQTRIRKAGDRKISQISIGELKSGMLRVIHCQKKIGFTRDSLIRETLKAFGFQKVTSSASNRMEQAFDQLLSSGQLEINDAGHVSIKA